MVRKFVVRLLLFVAVTHAVMSTVHYYDMNSAHIEQECFMDSLQCCVPLDIFVPPSHNERFTADVATIRRGIHMHWFPRDEYLVYKHPQESCQGQPVEHFDQDGPPMMVRTRNYEGIGISGVLLGQPKFPFKVVYPTEIRYHGQVYRYGGVKNVVGSPISENLAEPAQSGSTESRMAIPQVGERPYFLRSMLMTVKHLELPRNYDDGSPLRRKASSSAIVGYEDDNAQFLDVVKEHHPTRCAAHGLQERPLQDRSHSRDRFMHDIIVLVNAPQLTGLDNMRMVSVRLAVEDVLASKPRGENSINAWGRKV
ncbi:hypothetical protein G7Y79_00022g053060 [Physcia stellaris]|nr:hypothetical protein G7Y79_00022g053060 [Physcia stellaris]